VSTRSTRDLRAGETASALPFLPAVATIESLSQAVQGCRGCTLYADATQAVFGEGPVEADVMLVGEQPGDAEDRAGAPFVGPAGGVLDRALEAAEIERADVYVTNAVKHFKWKGRGTRRIHDKPSWTEQMACKPWLEAELALVRPRVLVLLGATAAQAMLGKDFRVTRSRGELVESDAAQRVLATLHPSAILRSENRDELFEQLVGDLRFAVERHAQV
jgi:uracil-DNA glycosylase family protein